MHSELLFKQVNLHRSLEAAIQLNNLVAINPAICLLTEPFTAFGKVANVPANHKCIPSTTLTDRPRAAILIPRHLSYVHLEQLSHPDAAVVLLNTRRGKILLASIYMDSKKAVVQTWMQRLIEYADTKRYPLLFGLDSNAHSELYGPDTNDRGKKFEEFILQYNLKVENRGEKQTYHAFRGGQGIGSCIDVTLSRDVLPLSDWRVNDQDYNGSDHHTISWSLSLELPPPRLIRPWRSANWTKFRQKLTKSKLDDTPVNFTTRKIDKYLNRIYKAINEALDEACPTREAKATPLEIEWFGKDQKRLFNRTKRKYARYRQKTNSHRRKAYVQTKRSYLRSCRRAKRAAWREFVEKTPDEKSMAKLVKIAQKKDSRTINTLIKEDNTLTEPGKETIEMLANAHFPAATLGTTDMQHNNKHKINTQDIEEAFSDWINVDLVRKALLKFAPYKAAGPDCLKPIVLHHLTDNVLDALTLVYQACIALKHTPKCWRETKVIFLPKPGKTTYDIPKSYRPISLSNFLLKGLERLVVWKMDKDLEEAPLHPQQHGFTKGKSTESAISNTIDYIEQQLFERSHCLGMFLDISSAFDSISIDHIKESLLRHNGDPDMVEWYYSYLGRRHLEIELHGDTVHLTTGTGFPQGGVCSAKFWLIAFDMAIQIINSKEIVGNGYADDCSALIGGTHPDNMIETMQAMLDRLVQWGNTCGLRFNPQKTVAVMFTRSTRTFHRQVRMDGVLIPFSDTVVYLGVTLDKRLLWKEHILTKIKRTKSIIGKMANITASYWGPKPKLLRWAYTGIARPVLTYAAMTWAHEVEDDDIQKALRRCNRLGMNTIVKVHRSTPTRALELILDILPLHLYIIKIGFAAQQRLEKHIPLTWEGVFDNQTHSVSHLRFWNYMHKDLNLDELNHNIDDCCIARPTAKFAVDLNSFVDMENAQSPAEYNIYTDGSKKAGQVGSGMLILHGENMVNEASIRLPDDATVFQAEIIAIREAAKMLLSTPNLTTVKFYVDSQAALRALHKDPVTSKVVYQTIETINRVEAQFKIFVWTKAHVGNPGNEKADLLAKQGAEMDDTSITDIPLPSTADSVLMTSIRKRWDREWRTHKDCRQTKLFYPTQNAGKAKKVIQWNRLKVGRYVRAITGHNNLLYHLHTMYNFISPICRFCNDANEEFYHLAYFCPALWLERQHINTLEKDRFNDWTPEQILEFAMTPKMDDAFIRPLYWIEEERELLEIPSQPTQQQPQAASSDEESHSDISVMDVTTASSSSSSSMSTDSDFQ